MLQQVGIGTTLAGSFGKPAAVRLVSTWCFALSWRTRFGVLMYSVASPCTLFQVATPPGRSPRTSMTGATTVFDPRR